MKSVQLMASAAGSAGDKTSVKIGGDSPFEIGKPVTVVMFSTGSGTAPAYAIEGSEDDSTFAELAVVATVGLTTVTVPCAKYMRVSVTTAAGTAGLLSAVALTGA